MAANTWERSLANYPQRRKSQLFISSPVDTGALVPEYPISGESFIFEPVKGQVQSFDGTSRPVKLNVKTARYVHES